MRHRGWITAVASSAIVIVVCLAAWAAEMSGTKPAGLKPLKVNKSAASRLSDGPIKTPSKPGNGPCSDNTSCYVCHGNYQGEELVEQHAAENIGCIKCHGESAAHRNDEDHRTPPDVMFASKDIGPMCAKCHETHDTPAAKVIARWREKCPARTNPTELLCTDCHGDHRLKFRSYWWDKQTRAYVAPKPGELRIKIAPDLTKPPHIKDAYQPSSVENLHKDVNTIDIHHP